MHTYTVYMLCTCTTDKCTLLYSYMYIVRVHIVCECQVSTAYNVRLISPPPPLSFSLPDLPVDVRSWTIPQVVKFFESTSDCKDYAPVFQEQEVDGTALLLLTHETLKSLGFKLGPASKIMAHVVKLQKQHPQ